MSTKSRRTKQRRNTNQQSPDILSRQKQTMKNAFLDYLWAAIMFFIMALIVFVVGLLTEDSSHSKRIVFGATPIILSITIIFTCLLLHRFLIFSKISKIKFSSEQVIEITCKKITFLTQPISRHSAAIICIILTDEKGKKYYNITNSISDYAKKGTKEELLNAKVSLICYANTNCVKNYQVHTGKE